MPGIELHPRISVASRTGTVKYAGTLPGKDGQWLGIDWDDEQGRHDGTLNGIQYFVAKGTRSGSFIRNDPQLVQFGESFLLHVTQRYTEQNEACTENDIQLVNWDKASVQISMVGFAKVQRKQRLHVLKRVSLVNCPISIVDPSEALLTSLPNLEALDLSGTLFASWDDIALLCLNLPNLVELHLNRVRLRMPTNLSVLEKAFLKLTVLTLNRSGHTFDELSILSKYFPAIEELHFGFNQAAQITRLCCKSVKYLNLENNRLSFSDVHKLENLPALRHLSLQHNQLSELSCSNDQALPKLSELWLADNAISSWSALNNLFRCFTLENLRINRNPVYQGNLNESRVQVIGRMPDLKCLNGSKITKEERYSADLYFLKMATETLAKTSPVPAPDTSQEILASLLPPQFTSEFPTYLPLAKKYGIPLLAPPTTDKVETIHVLVQRISSQDATRKLRVSPTSTVLQLKSLAARQYKISPRRIRLEFTDMENNSRVELKDDLKLLSYYDLKDGQVIDIME